MLKSSGCGMKSIASKENKVNRKSKRTKALTETIPQRKKGKLESLHVIEPFG
jgi:hypothetical protein